jgi:hypothetical protein
MDFSISHEIANFLDYGSRLSERLKTEGKNLSKMELRILSAQLQKLSNAVNKLDDTRWRDRSEAA